MRVPLTAGQSVSRLGQRNSWTAPRNAEIRRQLLEGNRWSGVGSATSRPTDKEETVARRREGHRDVGRAECGRP